MSHALGMHALAPARLVLIPVLTLLASLGACAGASTAGRIEIPTARAVPDVIVEDEALLDDALAGVRAERRACPERCDMAGSVCEAAERICRVVGELRDVSLAPRCDRARGACAEARERVSACGCPAGPRAQVQ
ncbi:MAG: hypothetical protein OHK0013_44890 [Sandaracinaceae bacterium]